MTNQMNVANAQGAGAAQETLMPNFEQNIAFKGRKKTPQFFVKPLFSLLLLILFCGNGAKAQNVDTLMVSTMGFSITGPNQILNQGETVTLDINLGTNATPVEFAREFDIYLELSSDAVFPSSPEVLTSNSWFFAGGMGEHSVSSNSGTKTITVNGTNSNTPSGNGILFQITLEAAGDGIYTTDLIADGGGLIMIDDLAFKTVMSKDKALTALSLYPNPSQDQFRINWNQTEPQSLAMYDQQGNRAMFQEFGQTPPTTFEVGHFNRGIYMLVIQYPDRQVVKKLLLH